MSHGCESSKGIQQSETQLRDQYVDSLHAVPCRVQFKDATRWQQLSDLDCVCTSTVYTEVTGGLQMRPLADADPQNF